MIKPGPILSDALASSPILRAEDGTSLAPVGTGFEFGIDPSEDPELAMVSVPIVGVLHYIRTYVYLDLEFCYVLHGTYVGRYLHMYVVVYSRVCAFMCNCVCVFHCTYISECLTPYIHSCMSQHSRPGGDTHGFSHKITHCSATSSLVCDCGLTPCPQHHPSV